MQTLLNSDIHGDWCLSVVDHAGQAEAMAEAELLRGVTKKSEAKRLSLAVKEFLLRVEILPWDSDAAEAYARLRTACENQGKPLGTMDMLIAAHSIAVEAVLITNDQAFYNVKHHLRLQDWIRPIGH